MRILARAAVPRNIARFVNWFCTSANKLLPSAFHIQVTTVFRTFRAARIANKMTPARTFQGRRRKADVSPKVQRLGRLFRSTDSVRWILCTILPTIAKKNLPF